VAIKVLHRQVLAHPGAFERFLREARVAMRLRSEHVARVHDIGTMEDGTPFIVMELLRGADLASTLSEQGPLPVSEAVDYVLQACQALVEAHASGVVHRDLKPANLFLCPSIDGLPCVKVLDFGVSKVAAASGDEGDLAETAASSSRVRAAAPVDAPFEPPAKQVGITRSSAVIGSPRYMAPEQIAAPQEVDARADVWALGTILFELLTGTPPFDGETLDELRQNVTSATAPRLPNVPSSLQAVVQKCLAKDPGARFRSVHALAEALAPYASRDGAASAARVGRIANESSTEQAGAQAPAPRRGRGRLVLAVLVGASASAVIAWAFLHGGASPRQLEQAPAASDRPGEPAVSEIAVATSPTAAVDGTSVPILGGTAASATARAPSPKASAATGGSAAVAVVDAGAPAMASASASAPAAKDPLRLDAGFLFNARK
jgi:serine/threonine-protein kinase